MRSPMEAIHANALQLAASEASAAVTGHGQAMARRGVSKDDAAVESAYLRHLAALLDEYLDDLVLEGMAAGTAA